MIITHFTDDSLFNKGTLSDTVKYVSIKINIGKEQREEKEKKNNRGKKKAAAAAGG